MRLQDLKADLDALRMFEGGITPDTSLALKVACRVADLYDECPDCGGSGEQPGMGALMWQCACCEGTGIAALKGEFRYAAMALTRYLFGEDT